MLRPHLRMDDDDKSSEGSGSGSALPTPSAPPAKIHM